MWLRGHVAKEEEWHRFWDQVMRPPPDAATHTTPHATGFADALAAAEDEAG